MTLPAIRRTVVPFITAWVVAQYLNVIEGAPSFLVDLLPSGADAEAWAGGFMTTVVFAAIYSGGNRILVALQAAAKRDGLVGQVAGWAALALAIFLGGSTQPEYTDPGSE